MPDRITGMVAQILNDRELVINRGAEHDVEVGMRFAVLDPNGIEVTDPETGEALGDVERPKTIVKVTQVKPKLAIASTYRSRTVSGGSFYSILNAKPSTVHETLNVEDSDYQPISEEESKVFRGDRIVEVVGDEFAGWEW